MKNSYGFDREYLKQAKASSAEQKLTWLAHAVEFERETAKNRRQKSTTRGFLGRK